MTQFVTVDRATLEQLVTALEKHHKQETRYSDNKRRANATCAHFTVNPLQELAEQAYMLTHGKETIEALTAGRAALAQQELPQKERTDFMAGYDAGMADAKRMAQQGEQQPVCAGCGIPAGDVHMSTCKSGKWPSRVSNGDTAAPAPQAQPVKEMPHGWVVNWPDPNGGTKPVYHASSVKPKFGAELDGKLAIYAVYTHPQPAPQAQQWEPVYQYQMADGSWIDQIKDSYDYNRKYAPNATVRVVYTAAPAPQSQEPAEWRTEAVKWIRRKAEDQRAKNEQNPRHAEAYPSWGERVRQWHWLADDLEMEQNSPPFGLESYQEPEPQPAQGDCGKLKELVRKSGAVVFDKDGSYGNYQGGSILFSPSQWESFANGLTLQKEMTK